MCNTVKNSCYVSLLAAFLLLAGIAVPSYAQVFAKQRQAEALYGHGVHAFFDKDYKGAVELFAQAEKLGTSDPRVYFFSALSHLRLNKRGDADSFFKKAAKLEQESLSARDYNVSAAISRIQGLERMLVEGYRRQARQNWQNAEKKRREMMYAAEKEKEEAVLRNVTKIKPVEVEFGARSLDPSAVGEKPQKEEPKKTNE